MNDYLNDIFVELDSVDSWQKKHIIDGPYIHIKNGGPSGLLTSYITLHFRNVPTDKDYQELIKSFDLKPRSHQSSIDVKQSKRYGITAYVDLKKNSVDEIMKAYKQIA